MEHVKACFVKKVFGFILHDITNNSYETVGMFFDINEGLTFIEHYPIYDIGYPLIEYITDGFCNDLSKLKLNVTPEGIVKALASSVPLDTFKELTGIDNGSSKLEQVMSEHCTPCFDNNILVSWDIDKYYKKTVLKISPKKYVCRWELIE